MASVRLFDNVHFMRSSRQFYTFLFAFSIALNIMFVFYSSTYKSYIYIGQVGNSTMQYTYVHTGYFSENTSKIIIDAKEHMKHHNRQKPESYKSFNTGSTKYLFIIRSTLENAQLRISIRHLWKNNYFHEMKSEWDDGYGITDKIGDINCSQILFVIEDTSSQSNMAKEMKKYNDLIWIPNSEEKSINSLHTMTSLTKITNVHFYIISQDTTFVNFYNVIHLLEKQGKTGRAC